MTNASPGQRFRELLQTRKPLVIAGAVNAYCGLLAERCGIEALYLSGAGVANASHGLPDLAMTSVDEVLEDAARILGVCRAPLLVDIDTGFGDAFGIARTVRRMEGAGVAAVHMEDQVAQKRCGHRPNKEVVPVQEMVDRLHAALDARSDLYIIARTDAAAVEGVEAALDRAAAYAEAGADAIFAEAAEDPAIYATYRQRAGVPVLANMTEFGKTPLTSAADLAAQGADMVLYPLSAFRAMSRAAEGVYRALAERGSQEELVGDMQTREELYHVLGYHRYEEQLDALLKQRAG